MNHGYNFLDKVEIFRQSFDYHHQKTFFSLNRDTRISQYLHYNFELICDFRSDFGHVDSANWPLRTWGQNEMLKIFTVLLERSARFGQF